MAAQSENPHECCAGWEFYGEPQTPEQKGNVEKVYLGYNGQKAGAIRIISTYPPSKCVDSDELAFVQGIMNGLERKEVDEKDTLLVTEGARCGQAKFTGIGPRDGVECFMEKNASSKEEQRGVVASKVKHGDGGYVLVYLLKKNVTLRSMAGTLIQHQAYLDAAVNPPPPKK